MQVTGMLRGHMSTQWLWIKHNPYILIKNISPYPFGHFIYKALFNNILINHKSIWMINVNKHISSSILQFLRLVSYSLVLHLWQVNQTDALIRPSSATFRQLSQTSPPLLIKPNTSGSHNTFVFHTQDILSTIHRG